MNTPPATQHTTPKKTEIFFAPLQGFTETPYREAHHTLVGGVARYGMPFLRLEHNEPRRHDIRELQATTAATHHAVPQVIAANANEFRTLALLIAQNELTHIEFNLGCPFPMQTRHGRGTAMMQHPDTLVDIINEMQRLHDEQHLTFSIKMRLGHTSSNEWEPLMTLLNSAPIDYLVMHPRIGTQQYDGNVDLEQFQRFYLACQQPLVYNGDINTIGDINRIANTFPKLRAIMIGRGLLARPTLAQEYNTDKLATDDEVRRTFVDIHRQVVYHYANTLEGGEQQVLKKVLPHFDYATTLFDHKAIKRLKKARTLANYLSALQQM
ncbi:MAG: tRNA-dihydrouridine synthase family protein [Bacteroidales bacterium]|nr:tRNA-dihydrouridine synthase family protein [Bacteroidales bacterium]